MSTADIPLAPRPKASRLPRGIYLTLAAVALAAFGLLLERRSPTGWFGFGMVIAPISLALLVPSILVSLALLLLRGLHQPYARSSALVLLLSVAATLLVWRDAYTPRRFLLFDRALRREITAKASLPDLQRAVAGLLAREDDTRAQIHAAHSAGSASPVFPDTVKRLRATHVMLVPAQDGRPSYMLFGWGGGQAHWGLEVGPPSLRLPTNETQWEWQPGIYAYLGN